MSETQRIFVAVPLPMTLKRELALYQGSLLRQPRSLKVVKPELFHITLHFFGDLTPPQVATLGAGLQPIAASQTPFLIEIGGVAAFPSAIVVPVITGRETLIALGLAVRQLAAELGLPATGKAINPHITIARVREGGNPLEHMNDEEAEEAYRWTCQSVVMYESHLGPAGASYTELLRVPFAAPMPSVNPASAELPSME
ncbi:MAG: RNA 2',3'-cyclic phosphodiesterase [bacterium]|nr:RNA 2',3'-cyclic phosphodiesterase [bacterium]